MVVGVNNEMRLTGPIQVINLSAHATMNNSRPQARDAAAPAFQQQLLETMQALHTQGALKGIDHESKLLCTHRECLSAMAVDPPRISIKAAVDHRRLQPRRTWITQLVVARFSLNLLLFLWSMNDHNHVS